MNNEPAQVPEYLMPIEPGMTPEEVSAREAARLAAPRPRLEPISASHERPPLPQ